MQVDIFGQPGRKDLTGWRGPGTILSLQGDGIAVVRWQGTSLDVALRHLRPHVHLPLAQVQPPPPEEAPAQVQAAALVERSNAWNETYLVHRTQEENFYNQDAAIWTDNSIETMVSICSGMAYGAVQNHSVDDIGISRDALRDDLTIFNFGKLAASRLGIKNYGGVVLSRGRRHLPPVKSCKWVH